MNRIEQKFVDLRKTGKKAVIVFITAGYPDIETTKELIIRFSEIGVDIIEIGVPFSDPMADGPLIQEASKYALEKNVHLLDILRMIEKARKVTQIPICLMTYYNPVFCFGDVKFAASAAASGVDGLIIPDLPPEEAGIFMKAAVRKGLDTIFFLAPTSSISRIRIVSRASKGFIYYVSLTGVTGLRQNIPVDLKQYISQIKKYTDKPVCVGFGISTPEQVKQVHRIADGAIIGSAVINEIRRNIRNPNLVNKVVKFVDVLIKGRL